MISWTQYPPTDFSWGMVRRAELTKAVEVGMVRVDLRNPLILVVLTNVNNKIGNNEMIGR